MKINQQGISTILNGNRIIEIPFFQRSYVWDIKDWERFLNDMESISIKNEDYYMSNIIMKQISTSTSESIGDRRLLIDGQQRLTTIAVFFKVLTLKTNKPKVFENPIRLNDNSISIKHNYNDSKYFDEVMCKKTLTEIKNPVNNIQKVFNFFVEQIKADKYNYEIILRRIIFGGIDLEQGDDEQQIFDSINSIGVKLTTSELLKNYLYKSNNIELFEKYWKKDFEMDQETIEYWDKEVSSGSTRRNLLDLFLFANLQLLISDLSNISSKDKTTFNKIDNLFNTYKQLIETYLNNDIEKVIISISENAKLFRKIFNFNWETSGIDFENKIDRINLIIFSLENTTLISYVLYLSKHLDEKNLNNMLGVLETYIMRRVVVNADNNAYNNLFNIRMINNKILTAEAFKDLILKNNDKTTKLPSDLEFKNGFKETILSNKKARGVLYLLESSLRTEFDSMALKSVLDYSLEHLMPKKWDKNWPLEPTNDKTRKKRNVTLLTLGNLAIISAKLNTSISNLSWQDKKAGDKSNPGLTINAKGIKTIEDAISNDVWNEETILKRADYLYDIANRIWNSDNNIKQVEKAKVTKKKVKKPKQNKLAEKTDTKDLKFNFSLSGTNYKIELPAYHDVKNPQVINLSSGKKALQQKKTCRKKLVEYNIAIPTDDSFNTHQSIILLFNILNDIKLSAKEEALKIKK